MTDPGGYAERAADQQLRDTVIPAPRGEIYAADGTLLAASETCWTIRAAPRELEDALVAPAAAALSEILELDEAEVLEKLSQRSSNDCLLRRRVDRATADAVRSWCRENGAEGIQIRQDTRRIYPEGDFMGCLLGFTDVDNAGLWGLELEYDEVLTGQNGRVLTAKNAWGYDMPEHYSTLVEAQPGSRLTLTVDANIQHILESAVAAAVDEHHVAARAVGIVMDVNTGAILAMTTQPDYDPNDPRTILDEEQRAAVDALTGEERSAALQTAQQAQWRNKAISDLYEPGSVFKLITCAAALDAGVVDGGQPFLSARARSAWRARGFAAPTATSTAAKRWPRGWRPPATRALFRWARGWASRRSATISPRSACARPLASTCPARSGAANIIRPTPWAPVELASCSFGQSSKVSYLQMLTAVAAVVNGGRLLQPYVVAEIAAPDGETVYRAEPTVRRQVISAQTSETMRALMEGVVTDGTGKNGAVSGYRVGGKTGTSQKLDSSDPAARIASYVAVAPIDDPQIAVLVCLDEPHSWTTSGGALSGPVCAQVLAQVLPYLGIEPDYTAEEQEKLFAAVPDVTGWRTDAARQKLAEYGFEAAFVGGNERVASQYPAAGVTARKGSAITLDTTGAYDAAADAG